MDHAGWIKLYRVLKSKAVWHTSTPEQKVVLVTILLSVNHRANQWNWKGNKIEVQPGQMITSLRSLADEAGVSIQNVRSALKRFKNLEFITDEPTKTSRLITVINWDIYQSNDKQPSKEINKDPTKGQQLTRIEECQEEVITYLNQKTARSFRPNAEKTRRHISARLNEGFSAGDLKAVIDDKEREWGDDPKMSKYLRPETLFGPKFEGYLQAAKSQSAGQLQQPQNQSPWNSIIGWL